MAKTEMTKGGRPLTTEDWKSARVNPASLPPTLAPLYAKVTAAQEAVNKAQKAFEEATTAALAAKLPAGQKLFVSHRFGRLCIMAVDGGSVTPSGLFA